MENKLEKYYDYIVKDMVRRTNVVEGRGIELPYFPGDYYTVSLFDSLMSWYEGVRRTYIMDFWVYVEKMYGLEIEEMGTIYQRYIDAMENKLIGLGYINIDEY